MTPANIKFRELMDTAALEKMYSDIENGQICLASDFVLQWFSDVELLAFQNNVNVVYQGRDCDADGIFVYKFRGYFVIYEYSTYGTDLEVFDIDHNYGSSEAFLDECFTVYDDINVQEVADCMHQYKPIVMLFKNYYNDDWRPELLEYLSDRANRYV